MFARQTERRQERIQGDAVRDTVLWLHAGLGARAFRIFRRLHRVARAAWDQFRDERQRHRVGNSHLTVRIDGDTAPFKHPQVTREDESALLRWRGEDTFIAHLVEDHATHQLVEHSGAPHVRPGQIFLRTEAQIGERLGFGDVIPFGSALRNRFFRGRDHQFAITAIQYEDVAGFRRGIDDRYGFTINLNVSQRRLGGHIHIPQIVVDGLVAPGQLTGGGVQRHNRAGVTLLLRRAVAAPDIRGGHAHRQIDQIQLSVVGGRRPGVR